MTRRPDWCAQGRLPAPRGVRWTAGRAGRTAQLLCARPAATFRIATQNPKYGHKLDFIAETRGWFAARPGLGAHRAGRRPEHRAAGARCLEPQAVARRGQPYAAGDRGADRLAWTPASSTRCGISCRRTRSSTLGGRIATGTGAASDRGRRLDHVWVTPDLEGALRSQTILKDARDWARGSDHVPVCVEVESLV